MQGIAAYLFTFIIILASPTWGLDSTGGFIRSLSFLPPEISADLEAASSNGGTGEAGDAPEGGGGEVCPDIPPFYRAYNSQPFCNGYLVTLYGDGDALYWPEVNLPQLGIYDSLGGAIVGALSQAFQEIVAQMQPQTYFQACLLLRLKSILVSFESSGAPPSCLFDVNAQLGFWACCPYGSLGGLG